jgi:hypothetical protein
VYDPHGELACMHPYWQANCHANSFLEFFVNLCISDDDLQLTRLIFMTRKLAFGGVHADWNRSNGNFSWVTSSIAISG